MKLLLLLNPSASSVTARARVVIRKALSADHEVTVAETSRRGHALRLARRQDRELDGLRKLWSALQKDEVLDPIMVHVLI